jgi:excisionase family DNA binding protein
MVTPLNSEGTPKTEFMTIDEFCHEYRIPKQTVYSKASKRKIPHHKFGKRLMFSRKAINEWLKQSERVVK